MPFSKVTVTLRARLLEIARRSIEHGLIHDAPLLPPAGEAEALDAEGASFVTLHRHGELRGCVGSLEPARALAHDVGHNAFNAAFRDPRFPPLRAAELDGLSLKISVIGPLEPLPSATERTLLDALEPGAHGVVLEGFGRRATFLPAVWAQLPDRHEFLAQLRRKAGLPADFWSVQLRAWCYRVLEIGDPER